MPDFTQSQCDLIAIEIENLEQEKARLQQELAEAPPSQRPYYRREIQKINFELARKRQEHRACLQQIPRPDLVAQTVILNTNHATKKLGIAALIKNIGKGEARGPFRIDLSVTLSKSRGGEVISVLNIVHTFEVPAGIIISGEPVLSQSEAIVIPTLSNEYVTERMEVPLCYRDEIPSCTYEFEFLVDAEQVIAETNERNNRFFARWWTTTPGGIQRETPFVIESSTNSGQQKLETLPSETA